MPELACVVLHVRGEPGLPAAVRSVLEQSEPVELVVVSSGGPGAATALRRARLDVRVIEHEERLLPGAARNVGVAATSAPYVAFLASDCVASPGWAAGRLREHRRGAVGVACAMASTDPRSTASNAALLLLHNRRLPATPPHLRLFYGMSYSREALERIGAFRPDVRAGEDSQLNTALRRELTTAFAADVVCRHRYPTSTRALVLDMARRGTLRAAIRRARGEDPDWSLAVSALRNVRRALDQAHMTPEPAQRRAFLAARPLVVAGGLAYAAGVAAERWSPSRHRESGSTAAPSGSEVPAGPAFGGWRGAIDRRG